MEPKSKRLTQEVRVLIDVSIDLDARYTPNEVRDIVIRGARALYRNNARTLNAVEFAEEAAIYSTESGHVEWTPVVFTSPDGACIKPNRVLASAEEMRASLTDLVAPLTGPTKFYGDGSYKLGKKGLSQSEFFVLRAQRIAKARTILARFDSGCKPPRPSHRSGENEIHNAMIATINPPEIIRRSFAAIKHPKGSSMRKLLNLNAATSEYQPRSRYLLRYRVIKSEGSPKPARPYVDLPFRTRRDAVACLEAGGLFWEP